MGVKKHYVYADGGGIWVDHLALKRMREHLEATFQRGSVQRAQYEKVMSDVPTWRKKLVSLWNLMKVFGFDRAGHKLTEHKVFPGKRLCKFRSIAQTYRKFKRPPQKYLLVGNPDNELFGGGLLRKAFIAAPKKKAPKAVVVDDADVVPELGYRANPIGITPELLLKRIQG